MKSAACHSPGRLPSTSSPSGALHESEVRTHFPPLVHDVVSPDLVLPPASLDPAAHPSRNRGSRPDQTPLVKLLLSNKVWTHHPSTLPRAQPRFHVLSRCATEVGSREQPGTRVTSGWPPKGRSGWPRAVEPAVACSDAEADSSHSRAPCRRKASAGPGLKVGSSGGQMPAKTSPRHRPRERNRRARGPRCLKTPGSPARAQARQDRSRLAPPPALTRLFWMRRSAHTPFFARRARGY